MSPASAKSSYTPTPNGSDVAIIGMAGRFPSAPDVDALWRLLIEGREGLQTLSDATLQEAGVTSETYSRPGYVRKRGVLERKLAFDAGLFGYAPADAASMDPQFAVFHEVAWEALEMAGYHSSQYTGTIGVYAGASASDGWLARVLDAGASMADRYSLASLTKSGYLSTRVAHRLDLTGPALTINTTCSTSLVAVHAACQALLGGDCEMALAGGVSVSIDNGGYLYQDGMVLSPDGTCRPFDADANGTGAGEGCGVLVLKRLDAAIADNDSVLAVIKGSAINNDGQNKVGFAAPSVEGQARAISAALRRAGIAPSSIGYLETHGTGTRLGDPIEIAALKRVFSTLPPQHLAIGSIKSNLGHLGEAAGVTGLIKAVLVLRHGTIPPSLNFSRPNPLLELEGSPFLVADRLLPLRAAAGSPARVGVSSFGIGGTNAHAILEASTFEPRSGPGRAQHLVCLSAATATALVAIEQRLMDAAAASPDMAIADLCYTLHLGRKPLPYRRAFVVADLAELAVRPTCGVDVERIGKGEPEVCLLFPGQGAQYPGMGRRLYAEERVFRRAMEDCLGIAESLGRTDLRAAFEDGAAAPWVRTDQVQPLLFAIEYALAQQLMHWGCRPRALLGHSVGEYVAACLAGVFSLQDAFTLVLERGRLMHLLPAGAMLAVALDAQQLQPMLGAELSIASANSPSQTVVAGDPLAVEQLHAQLRARGTHATPLPVAHAFHSHHVDAITEAFERAFDTITLSPPSLPFVSSLSGDWIEAEQAVSPTYWVKQMRGTVRFADAVRTLCADHPRLLVETGPGRTLCGLAMQSGVAANGSRCISLLPSGGETETRQLLDGLGALFVAGVAIDWPAFYAEQQRSRVVLPGYPFEGRIHYPEHLLRQPAHGATGPTTASPPAEPVPPAAGGEQTPVQQRLLAIWRTYIGDSRIGLHDDVFEHGVDSLMSIRVVTAMREAFDLELSLESLFALRTIAAQAGEIERRSGSSIVAGPPTIIARTHDAADAPLSASQKRMWIIAQFEEGQSAYNTGFYHFLRGLDHAALQRALHAVIQRHQILRTVYFQRDGEPRQRVLDQFQLPVERFDIRQLDPAARRIEAERLWQNALLRPIDLGHELMLRACVVRYADDLDLLIVTQHHISSDNWSLNVLIDEISQLYERERSGGEPLPPPSLQYMDYALWQRDWLASGVLERDLPYWRERLRDAPPVHGLALDFPRPQRQSYRGTRLHSHVDAPVLEALQALGQKHGATVFMVMQAAFAVLLARYSGESDIVVGFPVANRPQRALEGMLGCFVNTLVSRSDVSSDPTFVDFLLRTRADLLAAYAHQHLPFETLVEQLNPPRSLSHEPIVQIMLIYLDQSQDVGGRGPPLERTNSDAFEQGEMRLPFSKYDLSMYFSVNADGLSLAWEYATDLFRSDTIERMAANFSALLRGIVAAPAARLSRVPLLGKADLDLLAEHGNLGAGEVQPALVRTEVGPEDTDAFNFSLFYFASDDGDAAPDKYHLLTEGARFADRHGLEAVWMPERHFDAFGGAFPNPAVTAAVLAGMTTRVRLRAGSCVLPLHNPLRVAEDWAVIDNVSGGRVGIGFAAGFSARDFVLAPERFEDRRQTLRRDIDTVKALWRGEHVTRPDGKGETTRVAIRPRPVQAELPVWVTTAGGEEGFRHAGRAGDNVLTHLMGQSLEELRRKITLYRQERSAAGHTGKGTVTVLVHTFLAETEAAAVNAARAPFKRYLIDSVGTPQDIARNLGLGEVGELDIDAVAESAFERYYRSNTLMGTVERCQPLAEAIRAAGVNEIACLIDFGVDTAQVLAGLENLRALRERVLASKPSARLTQDAQGYATFKQAAIAAPGAIVVTSSDGSSMDRATLDARAQALARTLVARGGALAGQRIGLYARPGVDVAVGLLAILMTGAACVPLEIDDEEAALADCTDAVPLLVLAAAADCPDLARRGVQLVALDSPSDAAETPLPEVAADAIALVLYGEGGITTTMTHARLARLVQQVGAAAPAPSAAIGLDPALRFADALPAWLQLLAGARIALLPPTPPSEALPVDAYLVATDWPARWAHATADAVATCVSIAGPGHLDPALISTLQSRWPKVELQRVHASHGIVGPALIAPLTASLHDPALLGRPLPHVRAHLLDASGRAVPFGLPGRLWLGGAGVADGYVQRPCASARDFARDAQRIEDAALFDTGIDACWTPAGDLHACRGTTLERAKAPSAAPLPTAQRRNSVSAHLQRRLPAPSAGRLRGLADQCGATDDELLLAVTGVLLHRYRGQDDLLVGAGWGPPTSPILAIPQQFSADTSFADHLRAVRAEVAKARQLATFWPGSAKQTLPALPVVVLAGRGAAAPADVPLSCRWHLDTEGLQATIAYDANQFDADAIARWAGHFAALLDACIAHPDAPTHTLPMLPADEADQLLVDFNDTARDPGPSPSLQALFEAQVDRAPDATALIHGTTQLSYAALEARANRLAHALIARGAGPEVLIGLCMPRSPDLIVAMLAVLKAGAAYLPLDPSYPIARLQSMLEDATPTLVLAQRQTLATVDCAGDRVICLDGADHADIVARPMHRPPARTQSHDLAYVLYTSGSTGRPKGAMIEHRNVINLVQWGREFCGDAALARTALTTSINFDLAAFELYVPLCAGATVLLLDDALALPMADAPSLVVAVPSLTAALLDSQRLPASVQWLTLAGEPLPPALLRRAFAGSPGLSLCNAYGPTETTTFSTAGLMSADASDDVHIGRPIANTRLYVLDAVGQPVPIGVVGELHIGGAGVCRGYLHRPELTAERFIADPYGRAGDRLYRTGDRVRWRADGCLDYLGRADHQVKLRGFRIEPGEIETVLQAQSGIAEAVAIVRTDRVHDPRLVAYVTGHRLDPVALAQALAQCLPAHMLPTAIVALEQMPRLPNGKLDRTALPAPVDDGAATGLPVNDVQARLSVLFADVLGVSPVGINDDFYARGGHSLLAIQLLGRVNAAFGTDLVLRELFQAHTVAQLATVIEQRQLLDTLLQSGNDEAGLETFEF